MFASISRVSEIRILWVLNIRVTARIIQRSFLNAVRQEVELILTYNLQLTTTTKIAVNEKTERVSESNPGPGAVEL